MAFERNRIDELLRRLPEELQNDVLKFVESLLRRTTHGADGEVASNGTSSVRSFFGIWDSGDPRSGR